MSIPCSVPDFVHFCLRPACVSSPAQFYHRCPGYPCASALVTRTTFGNQLPCVPGLVNWIAFCPLIMPCLPPWLPLSTSLSLHFLTLYLLTLVGLSLLWEKTEENPPSEPAQIPERNKDLLSVKLPCLPGFYAIGSLFCEKSGHVGQILLRSGQLWIAYEVRSKP